MKKNNEIKSNFDFSSLLKYCSEEQINTFNLKINEDSISSLILNTKFYSQEELLSQYPNVISDKYDPLLFRFNKNELQLGKSLEHFVGGFYILDPSSAHISYQLEKLLPKNFISLDMCAAPGGKTIALNSRRSDGTYIANDIAYDRAIEIVKNTQRLGLSNVYTTSIDPLKFQLQPGFDLIILDVPCSGSGMIRKELKMRNDYSTEKVERLLPIQENLLEKSYELVKDGGIIAYSTCSLSIDEDEEQIIKFMNKHNDIEIIQIEEEDSQIIPGLNNIGYHMVPGIYSGEGIYYCLLRKKKTKPITFNELSLNKSKDTHLNEFIFKNKTYLINKMYEEISHLPYISLGIKEKDDSQYPKCIFDHSYCKINSSLKIINLTRDEALKYVQGYELNNENKEQALVVLKYKNLPLGLGKLNQGKIKNYLPKGLKSFLY